MPEAAICAPLLDADNGFYPDDALVAAVNGLAPQGYPLTVRCAVGANKFNTIYPAAVAKALDQWTGHQVLLTLENMARAWEGMSGQARLDNMPNAALGQHGDPLTNPWIRAFGEATITLLKALGPHRCPRRVLVGNEHNLQAREVPGIPALHTGEVPWPTKPSALGADAALCLYYHVAMRIKREIPWAMMAMPAPFSCLVCFHTDIKAEWCGQWFQLGIDYLRANGAQEPWPFHGLAVNAEGLDNESFCNYTATAMRDMMTHWGMSGPVYCTEWGVPVASLVTIDMTGVQAAVHRHFDLASFFQLTSYDGYGAYALAEAAGRITVGAPNAWVPQLQAGYKALHGVT